MAEASPEELICIKVSVAQEEGKELYLKIRRDQKLKKLLLAYCHRRSINYASTHFLLNGERFNHNKTPNEIGLEEDAEIEAMLHYDGGGALKSAHKMSN